MTASAVRGECISPFVFENSFGHDGAGGVTSAKKEDVVMRRVHIILCAALISGVQHPGAQHGAVGFVARMKALRNLPSTCGAISSTAIPASVRNTRASSMS